MSLNVAFWGVSDSAQFPAVVFPYMKSSKELDPEPQTYVAPQKGPACKLPQVTFLSGLLVELLLIHIVDDPVLQDGAPCSIQVTARRFQDEKCLAAARIIEDALRG